MEHQDLKNTVDKLKRQLSESLHHNKMLTRRFDDLQYNFDLYKQTKETQIAELKTDNGKLLVEYEEYKHNYEEYQGSVKSLKQCLDKIRSDYRLLSIENATLQRLLEKEKNV